MPLATILIEDSPAIRKSLIPALAELADVQVVATADTAGQGIAALKEHADTWQLAVVDMLLQAGNGLQVLRAGRDRRGDQRMIVLTNYATPDIRRKSIECGADAVFDKSTEIDEFFELCRQYSAGETPRAARPLADDGSIPAQRGPDDVEDLIERISVDRLLSEAVSGSVEKNAAAIRDHLTRQGPGRSDSNAAGAEAQPRPKDETDPTRKNARDGE